MPSNTEGGKAMASLKLTEKSQEALLSAQRLAEDAHNSFIEGLHLVQALIRQEGGIVPLALETANVDVRALHSRLTSELQGLPKAYGPVQLGMSDEVRRA